MAKIADHSFMAEQIAEALGNDTKDVAIESWYWGHGMVTVPSPSARPCDWTKGELLELDAFELQKVVDGMVTAHVSLLDPIRFSGPPVHVNSRCARHQKVRGDHFCTEDPPDDVEDTIW